MINPTNPKMWGNSWVIEDARSAPFPAFSRLQNGDFTGKIMELRE